MALNAVQALIFVICPNFVMGLVHNALVTNFYPLVYGCAATAQMHAILLNFVMELVQLAHLIWIHLGHEHVAIAAHWRSRGATVG